jgi:hypothetical protein
MREREREEWEKVILFCPPSMTFKVVAFFSLENEKEGEKEPLSRSIFYVRKGFPFLYKSALFFPTFSFFVSQHD